MKVAKTIKLPVKIKDGRFSSNLNMIKDVLKSYEGCTIDVIFKKRINKRSNPQNSYYFGVIIPITQNALKEEWGEIKSLEWVHSFLKENCNFKEIPNEQTGQFVRVTKSTTENDTTQQEEFHEKCRRLVKDFFNVEIPLPNEELKIEF